MHFSRLAVYEDLQHGIKTTKEIQTVHIYEFLKFLLEQGFKSGTIDHWQSKDYCAQCKKEISQDHIVNLGDRIGDSAILARMLQKSSIYAATMNMGHRSKKVLFFNLPHLPCNWLHVRLAIGSFIGKVRRKVV